MILICGIPSEPPVRMVREAARRLKKPSVLFNQRQAHRYGLHLEISGQSVSGEIIVDGDCCSLEEISGVYNRLMDLHDLPEYRQVGSHVMNQDQLDKSLLVHEVLADWLECTSARVMNRASDMLSNLSKPYQAQLIQQAGFRVPATLITNEPEEGLAFAAAHPQVIYKSISSVRSIVRVLEGNRLAELKRIRHLPTQFQEFIPGVNVRVHVAGDELFATEIQCGAVDYRYASQEGLPLEMVGICLPGAVEEMCFELSRNLRLPLCGIDLKRTAEGEYYCFEVNPSPGFSYYQQYTGQDIASAIVRFLASRN